MCERERELEFPTISSSTKGLKQNHKLNQIRKKKQCVSARWDQLYVKAVANKIQYRLDDKATRKFLSKFLSRDDLAGHVCGVF